MSVRILQGDCREVLKTLAAGSVQCAVTSPPYFGLRDYGVSGQIGLEQSPDAYIAELVAVFRETRRVLRDDGTLWLNLGDSYAGNPNSGGISKPRQRLTPGGGETSGEAVRLIGMATKPGKPKDLLMMPARVALALQADGWWLRSDIIWAKPNPMPESVTDRPTSAHEHVFLLTKRADYYFDAAAIAEPATYDGPPKPGQYAHLMQTGGQDTQRLGVAGTTRNARNVWTLATEAFPGSHFAVFPTALAERCIRAGTSERGACPHCGAPWERVVERDAQPQAYPAQKYDEADPAFRTKRNMGARYQAELDANPLRTGWRQTCACPAAAPRPCVVLDPFAGAFTTALVADRLGRAAVGIELSQTYCDMARKRLIADAGMFAEIAAE